VTTLIHQAKQGRLDSAHGLTTIHSESPMDMLFQGAAICANSSVNQISPISTTICETKLRRAQVYCPRHRWAHPFPP